MSGPATRRAVAAALVLLVLLLVAPGRTTHATWTDAAVVTGTTVVAGALEKPTLSCGPMTGNSSAVRLSWTPSTSPAPLVYEASIVDSSGSAQPVTSYVDVTPGLLISVLGHTVTVRVTGTLPGTAWSVSSDRVVNIGLLGLSVYC